MPNIKNGCKGEKKRSPTWKGRVAAIPANDLPLKRQALDKRKDNGDHAAAIAAIHHLAEARMRSACSGVKRAIGLLGKKAVYLNFFSQVCFIRYFGKSSGS